MPTYSVILRVEAQYTIDAADEDSAIEKASQLWEDDPRSAEVIETQEEQADEIEAAYLRLAILSNLSHPSPPHPCPPCSQTPQYGDGDGDGDGDGYGYGGSIST